MSKKKNKPRARGNGSGSVYKRRDTGPWYASWFDHDGKRRTRCTLTTDKQKALRMLAEWAGQAALRTAGVIDPRQEAIADQSRRPIKEHLHAYEEKMVAAGRTERHIGSTLFLIREVLATGPFAMAADISIDPINAHLRAKADAGASARTVGARVVAIKGFAKWLVETGKLAYNPLAALRKPSVNSSRSRLRRMLLPEEWPWLISATVAGKPWRGISPTERALLYTASIQTALRSSEIRSVTKADLYLAGDRPHIRCRAEYTKNGEMAKQYITPDLAEQLRQHVATKTPDAHVFAMPSEYDVAKMIRDDLGAARAAWIEQFRHDPAEHGIREESSFLKVENDHGEKLDFHALRHTTGAWLAIQGVHPKAIQAVMRHSSITLTMDTYGHILPDQHANAIDTMAGIFSPPIPMAKAAGAAVQIAVGVRTGATSCEQSSGNGEINATDETLKFPAKDVKTTENTRENESASCRARTYDPLIKSQLSFLAEHGLAPPSSSTDSSGTKAPFLPPAFFPTLSPAALQEALQLEILAFKEGDVE